VFNLQIKVKMVSVKNDLQKPGPVFLEMAKAAYEMNADYFFRTNDDSESLQPWARVFADALQVCASAVSKASASACIG